jgi:hypothetical protein
MAKYAARLCQPPIAYEFESYRIIIGEHDHDPMRGPTIGDQEVSG